MENIDYKARVSIVKALADETRMRIIDMLSCGEMCACDILGYLEISQSTLSYHMKTLVSSGLVQQRKESSWIFYRLADAEVDRFLADLEALFAEKRTCKALASACQEDRPATELATLN